MMQSREELFIFGSFAHDADGVLARIETLALMRFKRDANLMFCRLLYLALGAECLITVFADSRQWKVKFYDSQVPLWHEPSLVARGRV